MRDHDDDSTGKVQAQYNVTSERILNDVRGAESIIVLAVKGGKTQLWASGTQDKAQDLLTQYFPEAVLPEPAGFMAGAGADR